MWSGAPSSHGWLLLLVVLLLRCSSSHQSSGAPAAWAALVDIRESLSQIRDALNATPELDATSQTEVKALIAKAEEESRTARTLAARNGEELKKREAGLHRSIVLLRSKASEAKRSREVAERKEADAARARCVAEKAQREMEELEKEHHARELDAKAVAEGTHSLIEQSRIADLELTQLRAKAKDLGISTRLTSSRSALHSARLAVNGHTVVRAAGGRSSGPASVSTNLDRKEPIAQQPAEKISGRSRGAGEAIRAPGQEGLAVPSSAGQTGGGDGSQVRPPSAPPISDPTPIGIESAKPRPMGNEVPVLSPWTSEICGPDIRKGAAIASARETFGGPLPGDGQATSDRGIKLRPATQDKGADGPKAVRPDEMVAPGGGHANTSKAHKLSPATIVGDGILPRPPPPFTAEPNSYFEKFFDRSLSESLEAMTVPVNALEVMAPVNASEGGRHKAEGLVAVIEEASGGGGEGGGRAAIFAGEPVSCDEGGVPGGKAHKIKGRKKAKSKRDGGDCAAAGDGGTEIEGRKKRSHKKKKSKSADPACGLGVS